MTFSVPDFLAYLVSQFPGFTNGVADRAGRQEKKLTAIIKLMIQRRMEDDEEFDVSDDEDETLEMDAVYEECEMADDGNNIK